MALSERKLQAAIESLTRIRVAEEVQDDGLRPVWHQASIGADLLSLVNHKGRIVQQEFTFFEDHFHWTRDRGLRTGCLQGGGGSATARASELVAFDDRVAIDRVRRAKAALDLYSGADKYILHLRFVIDLVVQGSEEHPEITVTKVRPLAELEAEHHGKQKASQRWMLTAGLVLVGSIAVGVGLAVLLLS